VRPDEDVLCDGVPSDGAVAADVVPAEKGRVLLLEDDPAFQDAIRDYLAESGYSVVAVNNGGEGVRELLNGEFALILCDLQMPSLPGDMFYRAVERIRPDLCSRFVFMSGYRGDEKVNDYIKSIGCWLLRKPFPMSDLLALFAFADVRETYDSSRVSNSGLAIGFPEAAPAAAPVTASLATKPRGIIPRPPPSYYDQQIAPRLPSVPIPASPVSWTAGVQPSSRRVARPFSPTWADLILILGVVLGFQYLASKSTAVSHQAEKASLEAEWNTLGPKLQKARAAQAELADVPSFPARIAAEQAKPRWTCVLADMAMAAGQSIELNEIYAREDVQNPASCRLSISGQGVGSAPRVAADQFRKSIQESIARRVPGRKAKAEFETLEETIATDSAQPKATFTLGAGLEQLGMEAIR
jgi:CheY-like chemotaxis protein